MYDVFICHKSEDYVHARAVYDLLVGNGLSAFLSEVSLPELGKAEYQKQIDLAIESTAHLVVVASLCEYVTTAYVESEWRLFVAEKRSGRKEGNIITVLFEEASIEQLPITLRSFEAIRWSEEGKRRLLQYLAPPSPYPGSRKFVHPLPCCPRPHYFFNSLRNRLIQIVSEEVLESGKAPSLALWVSATCVSNRDYCAFVEDGGSPPQVDPRQQGPCTWDGNSPDRSMLDHPVIWVSHSAAAEFCTWLTHRERSLHIIGPEEEYTLPTLQYWKAFSKGARITRHTVVDRSWSLGQPQPTEPVWLGESNSLGVVNVFGNVFEWCQDKKLVPVKERESRVKRKDPLQTYYLAVGGGWASSRSWLEGHVGVWCPGGWAMKDGGLRVCLVSGSGTR